MTACRVDRLIALGVLACAALAGSVAPVAQVALVAPVAAQDEEAAPLAPPPTLEEVLDLFETAPPDAATVESRPVGPDPVTRDTAPLPEAAPLTIETTPLVLDPALETPLPAVAEPPTPNAADGTKPIESAPAGAGVSVGRLDDVTTESVGTLTSDNGGFGLDIWRDSDGAALLDVLARLPVSARSPAMHGLARRLLLSAAEAPRGLDVPGAFLAARINALLRLGAFDDVLELADLVPLSALTDAVRQGVADALFWTGDAAAACQMTRAQVRISATLYWRKALVYCQARDGQVDAAGLSLSLLFEQAGADDAAFLAAAAKLVGQLDSAEPALGDGLSFATTIAAEIDALGAPVDLEESEDADASSAANFTAGPAALRALAMHPEIALEVRLWAAEAAAAIGALAPAELAVAYLRPAFADDELVDPLRVAGDAPDALGRALLFQSSRQQLAPDLRAAVLAALFAPSPDDGPDRGPGFGPVARATGVSLLTVAPDETVIWFASDALPALIANRRYETAQAWYLALAEHAVTDPEALGAQLAVLPLLAAARVGIGRNWDPAMAVRWWRGLPASYDQAARAVVATPVFMVLDALGLRMGPEAWALYRSAPETIVATVPNVGIRFAMRDAARARRVGEAALWALVALGPGGPATADPIALGSVIRSLRAVGLGDDAQALALESLIERGR